MSSTYRTNDFTSINPAHIPLQPLPPRYPAIGRVRDRNQTLEDLGGTFLDYFWAVDELEERFAVRAAEGEKFLNRDGLVTK